MLAGSSLIAHTEYVRHTAGERIDRWMAGVAEDFGSLRINEVDLAAIAGAFQIAQHAAAEPVW